MELRPPCSAHPPINLYQHDEDHVVQPLITPPILKAIVLAHWHHFTPPNGATAQPATKFLPLSQRHCSVATFKETCTVDIMFTIHVSSSKKWKVVRRHCKAEGNGRQPLKQYCELPAAFIIDILHICSWWYSIANTLALLNSDALSHFWLFLNLAGNIKEQYYSNAIFRHDTRIIRPNCLPYFRKVSHRGITVLNWNLWL